MTLKMACPQCGATMLLNLSTSKVKCPKCGYLRPDEIGQLDKKIEQLRTQKPRPVISINHREQIEPRALAAFETGQYCLDRDDKAGALDAFRRAAQIQEDFADAHLWVAKLAIDRKEQRDALETL